MRRRSEFPIVPPLAPPPSTKPSRPVRSLRFASVRGLSERQLRSASESQLRFASESQLRFASDASRFSRAADPETDPAAQVEAGGGGPPEARRLPVGHGSGIGIGIEYRGLSGIGRIGRPLPLVGAPGGEGRPIREARVASAMRR